MKRRGIAASGLLGFAGAALSSVLGFVLIAVVGQGLGRDRTGAFFTVVGWFMIASTVLRLGADTGLLRTWSIQSADQSTAVLRRTLRSALLPTLLGSLVAAVLVHVAAPMLAERVPGLDPERAVSVVRVLGWSLPAAVVTAVLLAGLRGLGSVASFTVLQSVAVPVLRVGLAVGVVAAGAGLGGVLAAWAAPLPLVLVISAALVWRRLAARADLEGVDDQLTRRLWSFSLPRGAAATLEILLDWMDVLVIGALRGAGEAAVYGTVTRVVRAGLVVDTAVRLAVAPRIATLLATDDRAGASTLFTAMARVLILLAWPAYLVLAVFGPTVLGWFGKGFAGGAGVLVLIAASMMLVLAAGIVQSLLLMGGRSSYQLGNKTVAVVVDLVLLLLLVPRWGIWGAAVAWTVTLAVDTALATWQVRHRVGVRLDLRALALPAALSLLVVGLGALAVRLLLGQTLLALAVTLIVVGGGYLAMVFKWRRPLGLAEVLSL